MMNKKDNEDIYTTSINPPTEFILGDVATIPFAEVRQVFNEIHEIKKEIEKIKAFLVLDD